MNILHRWHDIERLRAGEMVAPHFVDLHISNECNMNCGGCAYQGSLTGGWMGLEAFGAIKQFLDVGVKAFDFAGGGEPTLIPHLPDLMQYIHDHDGHFALLTNGYEMDDRLMDVLLDHGTYCRISLEAATRPDYERYKRVNGNHWQRVIANVERLLAEKKRRKSQLQVSLKFSVGKTLRGEWHYLDIKDVVGWLQPDRVMVKALRHEPEELSAPEKAMEARIAETILGKIPNLSTWIRPAEESQVPQCYLNPLHTVMDHEGNIYLCCYYYYREKAHLLGNIFERSFRELWFSEEHKQKIAEIDRNLCSVVDCKFFAHHAEVERAASRGSVYWL